MSLLINALAVILWAVAIGTATIVTVMIAYVLKQAKWETSLKYYELRGNDVIDPQGHIITTAGELLKELQNVEERIAK